MKKKSYPSTETLIRRRDAWLRKLANIGPMQRGSLCTAQRGNHVAHQVTVSVKGKTRTVYVPTDKVKEVKAWIKNYRKAQEIIEKISILNMAIIHCYVPENQDADKRRSSR
jgi:hypothetical protein